MEKKKVVTTDFTRATFEQFLNDDIKGIYITAGDKIGRELEDKRIKSSPEGFLDYLKSQEQELLTLPTNLPPMTTAALAFLYANEVDKPETNWKAEYLKAIGGKGLDWFNDYIAKIWLEVRQSKIHQLIFRLSMNKAEFQRLLGGQLGGKMKSAERTLRKKIEGRQSRVDSPSFLAWLLEEREKILNSLELDIDDQVTHYATESPEQNAQSFVSTVEFINHPFPIDWWEMWENAMPFLSNFEARQNQNWKWKNTLMQLIKAVDAAVRVKVFTIYIEAASQAKKSPQPDFDSLFTDKPTAMELGKKMGLVNDSGRLKHNGQKPLAAFVWLLIEKNLIELKGASQSLALRIIAKGLGSTAEHKNTWNKFNAGELRTEAEQLLREEGGVKGIPSFPLKTG